MADAEPRSALLSIVVTTTLEYCVYLSCSEMRDAGIEKEKAPTEYITSLSVILSCRAQLPTRCIVAGRTCTIPCNCEEIQECKRQTINHGVISGTSRRARHQPRRKAWTLLIRSMQARLVYSIQSTLWPYQVIPCWALFGGLHWCDSNIFARHSFGCKVAGNHN